MINEEIKALKEQLREMGINVNEITGYKHVDIEIHNIEPGGIGVQQVVINGEPVPNGSHFSLRGNKKVLLNGEPITEEEAENLMNGKE
jgi:hypothetical protein